MTTMTSRQFNHDTAGAKRAARQGPVFITERGRPSHVLLSIDEFRRLAPPDVAPAEAIADDRPEADFRFDFEPVRGPIAPPFTFDR